MRDLEPVMSTIGDWVRYSAVGWIVWTNQPAADVFWKLRRWLDIHDQVLIAKMDPTDSFGSLSPWIWPWIDSKATKQLW